MTYVQVKIKCTSDFSDILIAELAEKGYDSFLEEEDGFLAYILKVDYKPEVLISTLSKYNFDEFQAIDLEKKNWNVEWEKNL